MKSYDQALNEIYQKAQARAEQIKKRNKIVLAILPVFCVIALTIAMIFLATPPATSDPGSDPVVPPNDSLQKDPSKDDPDKEKNDQEDTNQEETFPPTEDNDLPDQKEPEEEAPPPPEIKYVKSYSGKYIYSDGGNLSAGNSNGQYKYVYQSLSGRFLDFGITGNKEVLDDVDKTKEITIGGKKVELTYVYSKISEFEEGSVQQKYIDRHVYQATDGTSAIYEFSIQNGKLLTYDYLSGAQNAEGGTAESRAKEIALSFLRDQVGEKYSEYEMYGGKYTNPWGGDRFHYTFVRCIHGYHTSDQIQILLSGSGKVCVYYADVQGVFDDYEDILTKDLLDATLFELNDSVYGYGKNLTDMATVYIDENCNLYMGVKTTLGYEFYIEIDVDQ